MIFCQEVMDFKAEIGSAMQDLISWDILVNLMNDLCSSPEISKEVNNLLLNELKSYKHVKNEVLETEEIVSKFDDNEMKIELEKDVEINSSQFDSEENQDQSLSNKDSMLENEIVFDDENQYSCKKCSKTFKTKKGYLQHKKEKKFEYEQFETTCLTKNAVEKHKKSAHGNEKSFICSECGNLFKSSQSLKHHVSRIHKKKK